MSKELKLTFLPTEYCMIDSKRVLAKNRIRGPKKLRDILVDQLEIKEEFLPAQPKMIDDLLQKGKQLKKRGMSQNDSSVDEDDDDVSDGGVEIEAVKLDEFESLFRGVAPSTNRKYRFRLF